MDTPPKDSASDDDQPLTLGQLNAILSDFKANVDRALARQEAQFGGGGLPEFGSLIPDVDPNDAIHFSAAKQGEAPRPGGSVADRYKNQRTVKSTVQIPEKLHTALKQYGIDGSEPGESGPGLKLQTQMVIAIEEYLAKRKRT